MRCVSLFLCWILAINLPLAAASSGDAWTRLTALPPTATVTIDLWDGRVLKGTIQGVTPDGLAFADARKDAGAVARLNRKEIRRIRRRVHGRAALIGAGVGAGAGAAYGAASWSSEVNANGVPTKHSRGGHAIEGAAIFGIIGACVMAIVGVQRTIYDAPDPTR